MSHKLKFKTATGHYLVNGWNDVLSLRVCTAENQKLYPLFRFKCGILGDKLTDFMWISDDEHEIDVITCITRRWLRDAVFIPKETL